MATGVVPSAATHRRHLRSHPESRAASGRALNPDIPARLEELSAWLSRKIATCATSTLRKCGDLKRLQRDSGSGRGAAPLAPSVTVIPSRYPLEVPAVSRLATSPAWLNTRGTEAVRASAPSLASIVGTAVFALIALAVLAAAAFGITPSSLAAALFHFRISPSRRSPTAARSIWPPFLPDGRYPARAERLTASAVSWLRNIPTGSDTQILPPAPGPMPAGVFARRQLRFIASPPPLRERVQPVTALRC